MDVFGELRDEIRSVAMDHTLAPAERHEKLTALRGPIADALGELDRYAAADNNLREADASTPLAEVEWVRRNASLREELIRMGELTESALDEMGVYSHAELDRLEEEGLLEEAASGIAARWAEQRKPVASPLPTAAPPPAAPAGPQKPPGLGQPDPAAEDPAAQQMQDAANERALGSLTDYVSASSQQAEGLATAPIQQAVEENGGVMQGLDQRLKSKASIKAKVQRRRDTMPLASDQERAQITDGTRYTAVFPPDGYNQGVERTMGALEKAGFKQTEFSNSWADPDWAGLAVIYRAPGGQPVEVVFHTDASMKAMRQNQAIISRFRSSDDPHERYDLWHEMADNIAKAGAPKGAEQLGETSSSGPPAGPDGLPTAGADSFHSFAAPHELAPGDRAQDPLHGGVVTANGPAKTVASVDHGDDGTTVGWDDGSASKFQHGSSVKKLRGAK